MWRWPSRRQDESGYGHLAAIPGFSMACMMIGRLSLISRRITSPLGAQTVPLKPCPYNGILQFSSYPQLTGISRVCEEEVRAMIEMMPVYVWLV
jgi:hypothetical protein